MKVLQLIPSLENRAPVNFAIELTAALHRLGVEVDVCYIKKTHQRKLPRGLKSFPLTMSNFFNSDYDVVHSHMLKPNVYSLLFNRARLVATVHSDIWFDIADSHGCFKSKIINFFWIRALKHIDMNVCLSESHKKLYSSYLNNLTLIPNGIDVAQGVNSSLNPDVKNKISSFARPGKTLFSVGAFRKLKGLEQIIALLAIDVDKKCVFFGDGPDVGHIKEYAEVSGVLDRCLFLGFVENPFLYFGFCDALLLVSRSEGFPLSLLEAINYKVAVVCSDIPAFDKMFDDKLYKYELDNIESLKKTISLSIKDAQRVNDLYEIFQNNHTIDKVAEQYKAVYLDCCN